MSDKLRKVFIVIEETGLGNRPNGPDRPFKVYLDGDIQRLQDPSIKPDDLTAAEFWGSRLFAIVTDTMRKTGAVTHEWKKGDIN